ncbi:MAG: GerMN domain-containing protein [Bacillota bacterium]|nr:GerMN domain-containing protein [Bacillota bacterium]
MKKLCLIFVILLAAALGFTGCSGEQMTVSVYFADSNHLSIVPETREISKSDNINDSIKKVIGELLKGPVSQKHSRVIPKDTDLIDYSLERNTVTVNFSQEFEKTENNADRLLARYSVVNTLCSLQGVTEVQILVNGRFMKYESTGGDIGPLSMENVIQDDEIGKNQTTSITLYYASEDKSKLVEEKRIVAINDNETMEKTIITELLKGPKENHERVISSDTKLLSMETKDQICYVNFSKEFMSSTANAELSVYSVVNSLTQMKQITSVQFLIEGEKTDQFNGLPFSEPFKRDENLVGLEEKSQ